MKKTPEKKPDWQVSIEHTIHRARVASMIEKPAIIGDLIGHVLGALLDLHRRLRTLEDWHYRD